MSTVDEAWAQLMRRLTLERQAPVVPEFHNPRTVEPTRAKPVVGWDSLEEISRRRRELVAEMRDVRERREAS